MNKPGLLPSRVSMSQRWKTVLFSIYFLYFLFYFFPQKKLYFSRQNLGAGRITREIINKHSTLYPYTWCTEVIRLRTRRRQFTLVSAAFFVGGDRFFRLPFMFQCLNLPILFVLPVRYASRSVRRRAIFKALTWQTK